MDGTLQSAAIERSYWLLAVVMGALSIATGIVALGAGRPAGATYPLLVGGVTVALVGVGAFLRPDWDGGSVYPWQVVAMAFGVALFAVGLGIRLG